MPPRLCQQRGGNRRGRAAHLFGWLLATGALGSPLVVFAQDAAPQPDSLLEKAVTAIVQHIIYPVVQLLGNLLITLINILVSVAQYNKFIDAVAVDKGFTIVRDVANLFFIVVLLLIAAGTVLNIPQYRYNRLLPRLILMAVLINLSKEIAGVLIDIAQVVMLTFVNSFRDVAAGNLTTAFGLDKLLRLRELDPGAVGGYTIVGALLLALVLLVVAVFVVIAYVVILLVRIVALWVLVILSPIPYVLDTFPAGKKYASEWWDQFTKYVLCGPVIAFFLWLSLTVIAISSADQKSLSSQVTGDRGVRTTEQTQIVQPADEGVVAATISEISETDNLLSYLVAIILLFMTLTMAQRFCGAAGSFATSMRQRAKRAALLAGGVTGAVWLGRKGKGAAKAGLADLGRGLEERLPAWANVRGNWRAYKERRKEGIQQHEARMNARARDFVDRRAEGMDYLREKQVEAAQQEQRQQRFAHLTPDQQKTMFARLDKSGSAEDKAAFLTRATMQGQLGTLLKTDTGRRFHVAGESYSPETVNNLIDTWVPDANLRTVITEAAIKQNRYEAMPGPLRQSEIAGQSAADLVRRSSNTFVAKRQRKAIDITTGALMTTGDDVDVTSRLLLEPTRALAALPYNQQAQARPDMKEAILGRDAEVTRAQITTARGDVVEAQTQLLDANQWQAAMDTAAENPLGLAALARQKKLQHYYNIDTGDRLDFAKFLDPALKPDEKIGGAIGWRPSATTPGAQEPDFLRDPVRERYEATRAASEAAAARGQNFFASPEFRGAPERYLSEDEFRAMESESADTAETAGLKSFAAGSTTLGVDLSKVAGGKYRSVAGLHHTDPQFIQSFVGDVSQLVGQEISSLEAKTELTAGEVARRQTLKDAKARLDAIAQNPSLLPNLEVLNMGPGGTTKRHALAHERSHAKVQALGPEFLQQFMAELAPAELQRVETRMQQKTNDQNLTGREAVEEYLVEGLANRRRTWADQSADAIQLAAPDLGKLRAAAEAKGVDLDRIMEAPERAATRQRFDSTTAKIEDYQKKRGAWDAFFYSDEFKASPERYLTKDAYQAFERSGRATTTLKSIGPELPETQRTESIAATTVAAAGVKGVLLAGQVGRAVGRGAAAVGQRAAGEATPLAGDVAGNAADLARGAQRMALKGAAFARQQAGRGLQALEARGGAAAKAAGAIRQTGAGVQKAGAGVPAGLGETAGATGQAAATTAGVARRVVSGAQQLPEFAATLRDVGLGKLRRWQSVRGEKKVQGLHATARAAKEDMLGALAQLEDHQTRGAQAVADEQTLRQTYAERDQSYAEAIANLTEKRDEAVGAGNVSFGTNIALEIKAMEKKRSEMRRVLEGRTQDRARHAQREAQLKTEAEAAVRRETETHATAEQEQDRQLPDLVVGAEQRVRQTQRDEDTSAAAYLGAQAREQAANREYDEYQAGAKPQEDRLRSRAWSLRDQLAADDDAAADRRMPPAARAGVEQQRRAAEQELKSFVGPVNQELDRLGQQARESTRGRHQAYDQLIAASRARADAADRLAQVETLLRQRLDEEARAAVPLQRGGGPPPAPTPPPPPPSPAAARAQPAQPAAAPVQTPPAPRPETAQPPPAPAAAEAVRLTTAETPTPSAAPQTEVDGALAAFRTGLGDVSQRLDTLAQHLDRFSKFLPSVESRVGPGATAAVERSVASLRRYLTERPQAKVVGDLEGRERDRRLRELNQRIAELNQQLRRPPQTPAAAPARPAPKPAAPPSPPRRPLQSTP